MLKTTLVLSGLMSAVLVPPAYAQVREQCRAVYSKKETPIPEKIGYTSFYSYTTTKSDTLRAAESDASKARSRFYDVESKIRKLNDEISGKVYYRGWLGKKGDYSNVADRIDSLERDIRSLEADLNSTFVYSGFTGLKGKFSNLQKDITAAEFQIRNIDNRLAATESNSSDKERKVSPQNEQMMTQGMSFMDRMAEQKMQHFNNNNSRPYETPEEKTKAIADRSEYVQLLADLTQELAEVKSQIDAERASVVAEKKKQLAEKKQTVAVLNVELARIKSEIDADNLKDKKKYVDELAELQRTELPQAQKEKDEAEARVKVLESAESKKLFKAFRDFLNHPVTGLAARDLLNYKSIYSLPRTNKVTLLIGSQEKRANQLVLTQVKELVQKLIEKKYLIVYDGDSAYAPYLARLTGDWGIALFAKEENQVPMASNRVAVNNDYMRMRLFADSQAVIATPDSPVGLGLMLEKDLTHVFDPSRVFPASGLDDWHSSLIKSGRNLGVTVDTPKVVNNWEDLFKSGSKSSGSSFGYSSFGGVGSYSSRDLNGPSNFEKFKNPNQLSLSVEDMGRLASDANDYTNASIANMGTGGSVIFGSGSTDKHSSALIYETAYKLGQIGYTVATGGSGGAMETANTGAYNAGGPSIGVPLGGKGSLDSEKVVASSVHTKTIKTSGYEHRIPILLGEGADSRKLIIFAPGGNGTIKELATTFVRAASKWTQFEKVIFLDSQYYGAFVNWLMQLPLPPELKQRIMVTDSAEEVQKVALKYQDSTEKSRIQPPRKNQPTYVEKSSYSSGSSKYSGPSYYRGSQSYGPGSGSTNNDKPVQVETKKKVDGGSSDKTPMTRKQRKQFEAQKRKEEAQNKKRDRQKRQQAEQQQRQLSLTKTSDETTPDYPSDEYTMYQVYAESLKNDSEKGE